MAEAGSAAGDTNTIVTASASGALGGAGGLAIHTSNIAIPACTASEPASANGMCDRSRAVAKAADRAPAGPIGCHAVASVRLSLDRNPVTLYCII
jgi:hypothetical protein